MWVYSKIDVIILSLEKSIAKICVRGISAYNLKKNDYIAFDRLSTIY